MAEALPILIVEDDAPLREALVDTLELSGYTTHAAADGEQALAWLERCHPGLVLSDVQMPGMDGHALLRSLKARWPELPVLLMTAYGQIDLAVRAMREGAADYLPKPFEPDRLLAAVARYYCGDEDRSESEVVAEDAATRAVLDLARRVAATEASVLLTGESGVGKEVFARFIHQHSRRAQGPFIAVNCAAIPENLLEPMLFGHEKGAFTGATHSQAGKFEQAGGGVILLDEVSELPLNLQAKLLRVLQEREVERVGGKAPIKLDLRVLAASNRDLTAWVAAGNFREDLYYRLNIFPLDIPPLRQRLGDIEALSRHILKRCETVVGRGGFSLSDAALGELTGYGWPGNIRELANVLQRAMILAPGTEIGPEHLMLPRHADDKAARETRPVTDLGLKDVERETILGTLRRMAGSRRRTAEALNMSERTLRHKLKQYREAGYLDGDDLL
ncbi:MAG: sigma-54 dependent transcriptional regulator [Pseudomonadota bacterium]|nr:sigma-54 dependent transcriptional regulator [Pseudomonadota bacterium]MDP1905476.1 sigma-54 dependent transcriptional regulator [Pseudomonadota bacterium]MDP2351085.1 sigma-54 dependent transcriptional regulator [Pseudomonadota bacterium]